MLKSSTTKKRRIGDDMNNLRAQIGSAVSVASGVKTPLGADQVSQAQREAVAYFFARLKMVSPQQYDLLMPDDKTESLVKREYTPYLMKFTRAQIDIGFSAFHDLRQSGNTDYKFLDIDKVIGLIANNGFMPGDTPRAGMYRSFDAPAIEDHRLISKRKRAAEAGLADLKNLVGLS